jgi:hypothetical protein
MYCRRAALKRMTRDIKEDADGNVQLLEVLLYALLIVNRTNSIT